MVRDIFMETGYKIFYNYDPDKIHTGDDKVMREEAEQFILDVQNGEKCKDWKIVGIKDDQDNTGLYAIVIETGEDEAIIAFRGSENVTTAQTVKDWVQADFEILYGEMTAQEAVACAYLDEIAGNENFDKYKKFAVTGHSLGGDLALVSTLYTATDECPTDMSSRIVQSVSMDGPGHPQEFWDQYRDAVDEMQGVMTHYHWSPVGGILKSPCGEDNYIHVASTKFHEDIWWDQVKTIFQARAEELVPKWIAKPDVSSNEVAAWIFDLLSLGNPVREGWETMWNVLEINDIDSYFNQHALESLDFEENGDMKVDKERDFDPVAGLIHTVTNIIDNNEGLHKNCSSVVRLVSDTSENLLEVFSLMESSLEEVSGVCQEINTMKLSVEGAVGSAVLWGICSQLYVGPVQSSGQTPVDDFFVEGYVKSTQEFHRAFNSFSEHWENAIDVLPDTKAKWRETKEEFVLNIMSWTATNLCFMGSLCEEGIENLQSVLEEAKASVADTVNLVVSFAAKELPDILPELLNMITTPLMSVISKGYTYVGGNVHNIRGKETDDLLYGTGEADTISGQGGDDILYGEGGNDTLYGGDGDDVLIGGEGNDNLEAGNGVDRYLIGAGDGNDRIWNSDAVLENKLRDTIVFGEGIDPEDIELRRWGKALSIVNTRTGQTTLIDNEYGGLYYGLSRIEFADGTVWDNDTFVAKTITRGGDGNETVSGAGSIEGIYDESETFFMGAGDDTVRAGSGNDTIYGEEGNDALYGEDGDDVLIGGEGNDNLEAGNGVDRYLIGAGDGNDRIWNSDAVLENKLRDTIVFGEGIDPEDI
ncbi:MAG: DUF2974 domain-containing protein, partial [Acetatifactor muris]|nr:DUF2974 domain-containing protein [Acetatifactor muris]MCM1528360.1 DUF2974 domain-containing protein [Bacteroides sp.]